MCFIAILGLVVATDAHVRTYPMLLGTIAFVSLSTQPQQAIQQIDKQHRSAAEHQGRDGDPHSTVTLFAKLRGWSMSQPRALAT
jgi:hypothetical protein